MSSDNRKDQFAAKMSTEVTTDLETNVKRKRTEEQEELEIDLNAAEPPSKKALRKAKRQKTTTPQQDNNAGSSVLKPGQSEDIRLASAKRSPYGIWIGNLLYSTTPDELMAFVTSDTEYPISKDKVTRINLPKGPPKSGKPQNKGFAYVDFIDADTLSKALELSEKLFQGRRVLIKNANNFEGRPSATAKEDAANGKEPSCRVFIGNLAFDTTSEDLQEHFGVCGAIRKLQVAQFEDSGKCKGYAWIDFEQLPAAEAAKRGWVEQGHENSVKQSKRRIWLHQMNGRKLRVEFAEDPTTRYNKRFGKDAKKNAQASQNGKPDHAEDDAEYTEDGVKLGEVDDPAPLVRERKPKPSNAKNKGPYDEQTVKRLTGAITESKGKKVVFD